jgi:hypothetical protein
MRGRCSWRRRARQRTFLERSLLEVQAVRGSFAHEHVHDPAEYNWAFGLGGIRRNGGASCPREYWMLLPIGVGLYVGSWLV